ncbi:MAG TPA: cytochrome c-type biogenesis protein CcmH, partial [Candidatus Limnocylindrales bacterium]|nr:cytochrome c-type biogenesis protein CcmH [Candidatus Limnocylindrales bacterium]
MKLLPKLFVLVVLLVLSRALLHAAPAPDVEERTREIASQLRCVVCQNLSVADSPSEMAQQMRAIVREQVEAGRTAEQINDFFVSKYGEWVLLKPKTTGVSALLWILPYVVLVAGMIAALLFVRRIAARNKLIKEATALAPISEQTRSELLRQDIEIPDIEDNSPRAELLRERSRLSAEVTELEFDYQSGKLSESDYQALKQEVEAKGAGVIQRLAALPAKTVAPTKAKMTGAKPAKDAPEPSRFRRWQLVAGGVFLLLFGLALGVMLTQSIRPRQGENDTMTGDFMTGAAPNNSEAGAALAEGKRAFAQQELPKAIEAFKKVLSSDPDNPEAHGYMGFILMQAGHGDGALMAFEKALARAPNFPMALWGKAMVLYQDKKDFAGAREIFEKLLNLVPPGEERNEITKMLAEIPTTGGAPKPTSTAAPAATPSGQSISGKITIDPKLKDKLDPQAALFIIARSATGGGPPLAVKKIDKPTFPL